jgi:hypothetical protein
MSEFEPRITAFTCAYMSGDTAGAQRIQYPAAVKMVRHLHRRMPRLRHTVCALSRRPDTNGGAGRLGEDRRNSWRTARQRGEGRR